MTTEQPPYIECANVLRQKILAGWYGWRGWLPGMQQLQEELGLTPNTIYRALALLVGEGLVEQKKGSGYFVTRLPYPMIGYVLPVASRMKLENRQGYIRNVGNIIRRKLPPYLAEKIGTIEPEWIECLLQTCVLGELAPEGNERPTQYSHYYYVMEVKDSFAKMMQMDASLDPVNEAYTGMLIRRDEVIARFPTEEEAKVLHLPNTRIPILGCLSIVSDTEENILLIQEDVFLPRTTFIYKYQFENRPQ